MKRPRSVVRSLRNLPILQLISALAILGGLAPDAKADETSPKAVLNAKDSKPSGWSFSATVGFSNDNLLAPMVFAPKDRIDPRSSFFADDDGRTFGLSLDLALTHERLGLQFATFSWYEMLTQDGAQENWSLDRRADVLNNLVQVNKRFDLGSRWNLIMGLGLGAQTVGNLDGISLQAWWHTDGGFGGRPLGWGLQDDYGGKQDTSTVFALNEGIRLSKSWGDEKNWNARLSLGSSVFLALGRTGMSSAQMNLNGRFGHPRSVDFWGGVLVSGGRTNDEYLSFAPIEPGSFGYEIGTAIHFLRRIRVPISLYTLVQSNGSGLADTTFTIGFIFGPGSIAWLGPPR